MPESQGNSARPDQAKNDSRPLVLPPLNAILDLETTERFGWSLLDLAVACLSGGARFLQVRAKQAASGWLLDTVAAIVEVSRPSGATVIVNDRADVARLSGAQGVHLGQDDLSPDLARGVLGAAAIIGLSTHTAAQVGAALLQPVSYLAIGPVFGSTTKATGYEAVGLDAVRMAADRAAGRPVVAIGGITLDRAPAVIEAGAASVAIIGDLLTTGDPERRVRAYVDRLGAMGGV